MKSLLERTTPSTRVGLSRIRLFQNNVLSAVFLKRRHIWWNAVALIIQTRHQKWAYTFQCQSSNL